MTIALNGQWAVVQNSSSATCVLLSHPPVVGDCIIAFFLSNQGTPTSIVDSVNGATGWSAIQGPFGPTGGSRNYSLYMAFFPGVASSTSRSITWTGGGTGQNTGTALHFGGLASVSPYDLHAANTGTTGTALTTGTTGTTTFANEVLICVFSVDTTGTSTWSAFGAFTEDGSASTSTSGGAPNIAVSYQMVSATGTYSGGATSSASSHWLAVIFTFADSPTGIQNFTMTCAFGAFTMTGFTATMNEAQLNYFMVANTGFFDFSGSPSAADVVMDAGAGSFTFTGESASGGKNIGGIGDRDPYWPFQGRLGRY